jgi:hypothetical protein
MTGPLDPPVAHGRLDEAEARALTDAARLLDTEGPLDASDARTLTAAARDLAHLLWRMLLRLYEGDGWRVLGFKSWGGYYAAELGGHRSRGYRLLDAGRVLEQLEPDGFRGEGTPGSPLLTERTARELAPILRNGADAVRDAWNETVERHGPDPTARQVRNVVKRRQGKPVPPPPPPPPAWVARAERLRSELDLVVFDPEPEPERCRELLELLAAVAADLERLAKGEAPPS